MQNRKIVNAYLRVKRFINKRMLPFRQARASKNFIQSTIGHPELVDRSACITDSVLAGNVYVGQNATILESRIRGEVQIGDHCGIDRMDIIGSVKIGRRTALNGPSRIYSMLNPVMIGSFCSIAGYVTIQEYSHNFEQCSTYFVKKHVMGGKMQDEVVSKGDVLVGNDVWIGTQTVILSGAKISDGVVIGANSTVVGIIPPYAIAVGSPARVIKYRFERKIIDRLLELEWWTWSDDKIRENADLFDGVLTPEKVFRDRRS